MLASPERPGEKPERPNEESEKLREDSRMERFPGALTIGYNPPRRFKNGVPFQIDVMLQETGAYKANIDRFTEIAVSVQSQVFNRSEEQARGLISAELEAGLEAGKGASLMVARPVQGPLRGREVAIAMHRMLFFTLGRGGEKGLLYGGRQIIGPFQGMELGDALTRTALLTNPLAEYMGYRGQNPLSSVSIDKVADFDQERHFPYIDTYESHSIEQELMGMMYWAVHRLGEYPNHRTGVSKGDLGGANPSYTPDPNFPSTYARYIYMRDVLGVDFENGDSVYSVIPIRRS